MVSGTMGKLIVLPLHSGLLLNKDLLHKHELQRTRQHYIKWKIEGFVTVFLSREGEKGKGAVASQQLKQGSCLQTEDKSTDRNHKRVANT